MAVSSVSYTKTPQAGDDSYIWTEDQLVASGLYSHEYDSLISRDRNVLTLDVMANDLGGKAKSLFSVDDGGSGALSDLLTRDVNTVWQNFDNYSIRIANGKIEVDISKLIQQAGGDPSTGIDSLRAGQNINTSFVYAIQMGNGTISYATVTLQIQGYNDAATISSSSTEDTIVVEAGGTNNASIGDATASGKLTVNDVDAGENKFQNPQTTQLEGQYGTFTFNAETGDWTYTLDEAKANTMVQGEVHEEVLTVTSIDGTASYDIRVNVTGANDAPSITSGATGSVNENAATSTIVYAAAASDVDAGDSITWSLTGADADAFNIDADGNVTLKASADFETKSSYDISVVATDAAGLSDTKDVTISINNVNETATITAAAGADNNIVEAQWTGNSTVTNDANAGGQLLITDEDFGEAKFQMPTNLSGNYGSFTFDADTGVWGYILDQAIANALTENQKVTDSLTVTSFDGTATHTITVDITGKNDAPSDLALRFTATPSSSLPSNEAFGQFSVAADTDGGGSYSYSLTGLAIKDLNGAAVTDSTNDLTINITGALSTGNGQNSLVAGRVYELDVQVTQGSGPAAVTYTEKFTVITGTNASQTIGDLAGTEDNISGDDVIFGLNSNDIIYAGSGHDIVFGQDGSDTIYGGDGNDQIHGGKGSDELWGGAGADVFKWALADVGTKNSPAADVVKDFGTVNGDRDTLDLADLLDTSNINNLVVTQGSIGTYILLTDGGSGNNPPATIQSIFLEGYTADSASNILNALKTTESYTSI